MDQKLEEAYQLVYEDLKKEDFFHGDYISEHVHGVNAVIEVIKKKAGLGDREKTDSDRYIETAYGQEDLKEFAKRINGVGYGWDSIPQYLLEEAKEKGIVIVYGASDDLMEFVGAYEEEGGCFQGGDVFFDEKGTSDDGLPHKNVITAKWYKDRDDDSAIIPWAYETVFRGHRGEPKHRIFSEMPLVSRLHQLL